MNVRLIGCLHFMHPNMAKHRGFNDEWEHDDYLIKQFNSVVTSKKDITYILGDVTMEHKEHYYKLDLLNGIKHIVLGNHDKKQHIPELLKYVDSVSGMIDYKGFALTHCPIHPCELSFYRGNIHAHIHHLNKLEEVYIAEDYGKVSKTQYPTLHKYHNVDAKLIDYKPKTIDELIYPNINNSYKTI